ncbi:UNVERIFIED_CONTAM: hypothetical protein HHA_202700 [Hammondia hammondi]|eukprot:XP_008884558.1 hypothetical protein HHA_202700 [Hammondia hammondi]
MDVTGALARGPEEARNNPQRGSDDVKRGAEEERGRATETEGADVCVERGEEREKEDGNRETAERGDRCRERGERETRRGEQKEDDAEARRVEQILREAADENGVVEAMIEVQGGLRIRRAFRLSDFFRRNTTRRSRTVTRAERDAARSPRRNADAPDAVDAPERDREADFQQEERGEEEVAGGSIRGRGGKKKEEEDRTEDWILVYEGFFVKRGRRLSTRATGSLPSPPSSPLCSSSCSSSSRTREKNLLLPQSPKAPMRTLLQSVPTAEFELHRFLSSTSFLAAPVETVRKRRRLERGGREPESRGAAADPERHSSRERLSKEGREEQEKGMKKSEVWREEGETDGGTKQERHDERGMEGDRVQEDCTQGELFDADDVEGEAQKEDRQVKASRTRPESSSMKYTEGEKTEPPRKRETRRGWTRAATGAKTLWLESLLRPKMVAVAAHLLEANGRDADIFACKRFPSFELLQAAFLRALGASASPTSPGGSAYRRRRRPTARAAPAGVSRRGLRPCSVQKDSPFLSAVASGGQIVSACVSPQSGFESEEEEDTHEADGETNVSGQSRRRLEGEDVSLLLWLLKDFLSFTDLCHLMCTCTVLQQELSHALYWTCLSFRPLEAAGTVSCRGRQCRPSAEAQQEQLFSILSQPRFSTFSGVSPSFGVSGSDSLRANSRLTHLRLQMHLGPSFGPSLKVTGLTCLHRVAAAAPNLVHLDLTGCLPPGAWCDGRSLLPHLRHLFPSLQSFVTSRGAEVSVAAASAKNPERKPRRADQEV